MSYFEYRAERQLSTGHVAGTEYTLEFNASLSAPSGSVNKRTNESVGGQFEGLRHAGVGTWSIQAAQIALADIDLWQEFLHSVDNYEPFEFDPFGTVAIPSTSITRAYLITEQWSFDRLEVGLDVFRLTVLKLRTYVN